MRHGTHQLSGERAHHGAWHPATGLVLRRRVAGFVSAVDNFATQWLWTYNSDRPNMSIGGIRPAIKLKMAA